MTKSYSIHELDRMLGSRPANQREAIELFKQAAQYVSDGSAQRRDEQRKEKLRAKSEKNKIARKVNKLRPPSDDENGFFKRGAYRLITRYIEWQYEVAIEQIVKSDCYDTTFGPGLAENPFRWGLLAFYEKDEIGPQKRHLLAAQMLYAHRHRVPEHFLIGFLYQLGRTDRIYEKVRADHRETWFETFESKVSDDQCITQAKKVRRKSDWGPT